MNIAAQLANHLRQVYFGGNWTVSNLKEHLQGVSYKDALQEKTDLNSIAQLTYHIHYFLEVQLRFFNDGTLEGNDALSFNHPPIASERDWQEFLNHVWSTAEALANRLEKIPDSRLHHAFGEEKYGTYFRNILGVIEHTHYHLGQIVLLKNLL